MPSHSSRWPLVLSSGCVFFVICTEVLPVGLLPEIGQGLHTSTAATGVLVSLYAVVVAVMSLPIAAVAERWPRRLVLAGLLAGLLAGYAASNVLFAIAPNYPVAVIARILGGVAHAGFFPVAVAAVAVLWGVAFGGFPTLTQTVILRAAGDATDAASALANATTNIGISGGAFLGSRLLGVLAVPALGWIGAGLVAAALLVYTVRLRRV